MMHGVVGALWLAVIAVSVFGWARYLKSRTVGTVAVPYESRQPVPWGLLDLVLIMIGIVMLQVVASGIAAPLLGEQALETSPIVWMAISQGALLIAWGLIVVLMRFRSTTPWTDLGLVFQRNDIKLGAFAFAMMAVPMFAIQGFLAQFTDAQHPLIESLLEDSETSFFLVGGFAAVIVAPIVEEFLFRVFLQGWLENLAAYHLAQRRGVRFSDGFGADLFWGLGRSHSRRLQQVSIDDLVRPVEPPTEAGLPDPFLPMRPAWWPILASAALFSAAHLGNGPDPIPLFFLALGLGLLYQRTHRVWPCITVHCMLNFVSMFNLWVIVNSPSLSEQLLK